MRRPLAPRSQPNLILGMVDGMSWEEIRPFVVSLRRTSYDGNVLLFVADLDSSTVDSITSAGIHVVKARRLQMQVRGRLLYPYHPRLQRLDPLCPGVVRSVSRVSNDPARTSAALGALLSVRDISRFFRYHRHLSKHGGAYANVMLTDVRDVSSSVIRSMSATSFSVFWKTHARRSGPNPIIENGCRPRSAAGS